MNFRVVEKWKTQFWKKKKHFKNFLLKFLHFLQVTNYFEFFFFFYEICTLSSLSWKLLAKQIIKKLFFIFSIAFFFFILLLWVNDVTHCFRGCKIWEKFNSFVMHLKKMFWSVYEVEKILSFIRYVFTVNPLPQIRLPIFLFDVFCRQIFWRKIKTLVIVF